MNEDTIILVDEMVNDVGTIETVDRVSGRYMRRISSSSGWDRMTAGICRPRPFSGLPAAETAAREQP